VRTVFLLLAVLVLTIALGCGAAEPPLHPVRGQVAYRGKLIPKAELTFHPQFQGPGWMPVAIVADDGSFAASTKRPGDGALAGLYKVTIVWRPTANEDGDGPNRLPVRYARAQTTPLTVEVGPASGNLPTFELTD
jgi:hypothetical protein